MNLSLYETYTEIAYKFNETEKELLFDFYDIFNDFAIKSLRNLCKNQYSYINSNSVTVFQFLNYNCMILRILSIFIFNSSKYTKKQLDVLSIYYNILFYVVIPFECKNTFKSNDNFIDSFVINYYEEDCKILDDIYLDSNKDLISFINIPLILCEKNIRTNKMNSIYDLIDELDDKWDEDLQLFMYSIINEVVYFENNTINELEMIINKILNYNNIKNSYKKINCKACGKETTYNECGTCPECHTEILKRMKEKQNNN